MIAVVTYRFTTLGFFLTGVGIILAGTQSWYKYLLLTVITLSLYTIEIRNRFLKNHLEVHAKHIEKKWGYIEDELNDFKPVQTHILCFTFPNRYLDYADKGINHGLALDILYISVFIYALVNAIILGIPAFTSFIHCFNG